MSNLKPILFNTAMVQAILDGRKTTTRRIITNRQCYLNQIESRKITPEEFLKSGFCTNNWSDNQKIEQNFRKPYEIGDILYVRETWCRDDITPDDIYYRADYSERDIKELFEDIKWRPSIHMPKEASRIFLKVKDVRVEKLQDIDDEGAKAEGSNVGIGVFEKMKEDAIDRFKRIWNSTLKKDQIEQYGFDANPWVWVIEFERCEKPNL